MGSFTTLPVLTGSTSQGLLHNLPSLNQRIPESRKDLATLIKWRIYADALKYASSVYCRQLFIAHPMFSKTILSSVKASQELLEAIQIWQEKGTSTFYLFEAQLQFLEQIYTFREPRKVQRFLERNVFLAPLLIEAYFPIRNRFPDSQVFLEIDTDLEEANEQQLIAFIGTKFSPKEALRRLKQLDEDWWLDTSGRAQGKLSINVEFE